MKTDHNHMNQVNKKDSFAIEQNQAEKNRKLAIEKLRKIKQIGHY